MRAPGRWILFAATLACVVLTAGSVTRMNSETACWAVFALLCALPMMLVALPERDRLASWTTWAVLLVLLAFRVHVQRNAGWSLTVSVDAEVPLVLADERTYVVPTQDAKRIPLHAINDAWVVREPHLQPCTATWVRGTDTLAVKAPLVAFISKRNAQHDPWQRMPSVWILIAICVALPLAWSRAFLRALRSAPLAAILSGSLVLLGLIAAAILLPPTSWLSNEFLSRPDDWLCYETGARSMLRGNLLLMPPPGGVEVWSLLYTPTIATLHALLGPALGPIYLVQFAAILLLVPLAVRLFDFSTTRWSAAAALAILLFAAVDVQLHYAWHLLSDPWALLLFLLLFVALKERRDPRLIGLLCGALYLTRLELIGVGLVVLLFMRRDQGWTRAQVTRFVTVHLLCVLPYLVRWSLLYGTLRPFPVAMEDTGHVPLEVMVSPEHIGLKLRALFGDLQAINPALRFRFHWLPIHLLFAWSILWAGARRSIGPLQALVLMLFLYVLCTRMLSPSVGIYGHRHSLALILLELVFIGLTLGERNARAPSLA